ncbi:hypothetical protein [Salinisphaera sp. S4-8]|uniref:hypothetical protein n=1 Tax=Salinisphaera sp. S4-8 TaxID=633357 RepID=UPI003340B33A
MQYADGFGRWPEIREQGFWKFAIEYGIRGWALRFGKRFFLFVLVAAIINCIWSTKLGLLLLFAYIVMLPVAGLLWSILVWLLIDYRYKKQLIRDEST